ncbi:MAG TPA: hypothetical protein VMF69_19405 [Gemmataceae bacterium]|nr:hypothetical protein [Gemmataceae bacterium]
MTLNFSFTGERVEISQDRTSEIKSAVLEFQPVIVSVGGNQVPSSNPTPDANLKITIDPEKLKN